MSDHERRIALTDIDARAVYADKYGSRPDLGWGPRLRLSFNYFSPDEYYEGLVKKLVSPGCAWADVGCGRDIFPSNPDLASRLAKQAGMVVGIDPDENVNENPFVTERFQGYLEEYRTGAEFDLITLRMVAEHVAEPDILMEQIVRLLAPRGRVVIYTVNRWSPMSLLAWLTPMPVHHFFKKILWNAEERDTFPVQYKMNTRKDLTRLARRANLTEELFMYLDDCRVFGRSKVLNRIELWVRRIFRRIGLLHPENCILAVYSRREE